MKRQSRSKGEADAPKRTNRRTRPKVSAPPPEPEAPEPEASAPRREPRLRRLVARLRAPALWAGRASLVVIVAVGAIALGRLVERHVRTSDAFAVSTIELEGHVRLERAEILDSAGLELGQNVFDVAPEEAEARVADLPWIAWARVTRRLPGSYRIEVRERRAVAVLALDELFLVADDGAVFKALGDGDPVDLPVITGVVEARFTSDRAYRTSVLLEVVALLHDYRGSGLARIADIEEVHVERDDGVSLFVGEHATHVRLGHGPFRPKLARLRRVLDELSSRGARPDYVYLDNPRRPDRVTVRVHVEHDAADLVEPDPA